MTDEDFRKLCNVYGFAPSRALRELIDAVLLEERKTVTELRRLYEAYECNTAVLRTRKDKQ